MLIALANLFRIKSLNVKFSKYQKQSPGGVLKRSVDKIFAYILASVFNLKFQAKKSETLLKKHNLHMCFPKNFAEVLRTPCRMPTDCFF